MSGMQLQIQIGNTCKEVKREGKTKYAWTIYMNAGEHASKVQKVVFLLHETFKNPELSVESPNSEGVFASRELTGWGTFEVGVIIHWHPTAVCRFGKTTKLCHELSFSAAETTSTFEVSGTGVSNVSEAARSKVGVFAPVSIHVVTLSGETLLSITEGSNMACADVAHALEDERPLLPGHKYNLAHGDINLMEEQKMSDLDAESAELKLTAIVQQKESFQTDLNMAVIKAAEELSLEKIKTLLAAGASAAFVHDPEGTWGSCDAKSALHVAIQCKPRAKSGCEVSSGDMDHWKVVIEALLEAKADVNAQRRQSDWRGCGSSSTAFEMVLPAAMQDAALLKAFLAAGANPNTASQRSVHSMRSDGGSRHCVLHTAVSSGNFDVVRTLLEARADSNERSTEMISNERGHNRDTSETSLHIACKSGDVKTCALLIEHRADLNAIRKDLICEDIPEAELVARHKSKGKKIMMCDDPRDPDYVCPVRCISVQETPLHIAVKGRHEGLVTLLACAGADKCLARQYGETSALVEELCSGETSLLSALSATWPLSASCHAFRHDELAGVEAAVAVSTMMQTNT